MPQMCKNCKASFEITAEDLAFYDKVSPRFGGKKHALPPPKECPSCRYQQRLTWRNERNLYRRTCAATSHDILSIFSPDKEWPPVYEQSYWWSDKWDAKTFGRDFDFSRPFFEQWADLFRVVPQIAMNNQQSENCEFTNQSQRNKDCYLIICSNESRDCLHGMWYQMCLNCVDSLYLGDSELCYEIVNGENCYHCTFSQNLENCSDVHFSRNGIGCRNCVGCVNLRNKEFHIYNEPYSREEYEKRLTGLQLHNFKARKIVAERVTSLLKKVPHKYYVGANIENATGDYLMNVREIVSSFNCRNAEYLTYCQDVWGANHCSDLTETIENSFSYSLEGAGVSVNTLFSKKFMDCNNSMYCSHCNFSKNLFGCIGLNHGQYCILNKQYSKEEYEVLASRTIEHMRKTGEWGEHFPSQFSPFGYNESVAQEYFPLTRDQASAKGFRWSDYEPPKADVSRTMPATQLPDAIDKVPDEVTQWGITCEATGKPFRVIKQELDFYRRMHLPLPHLHPDERHRRRMAMRNPRKLWQRNCMKCQKPIQTSYAPDRSEIMYCEECYLKEVY